MVDSDLKVKYENLLGSCSEENNDGNGESDNSDTDSFTDWKQINIQPDPCVPQFPFTGVPGPTFQLSDAFDVLQYFQLFVDDSMLELLVLETNRFTEQKPGSSSNRKPVEKSEMMIFLTIKILQGIIKMPDETMYWSTHEIFSTPIFPKLMTERRYLHIKRNLHFSSDDINPNPKLSKIWPIFEYMNRKCSSLYIPQRDITIDESQMLYRCRSSWVQYIPLKWSHVGTKLYLLCESQSGYLFSLMLSTGNSGVKSYKHKDIPITLLEPLLYKGYCLTIPNCYTSPQLDDFLINHNINRKETPVNTATKEIKESVEKEQVIVKQEFDIVEPEATVKSEIDLEYNDIMDGVVKSEIDTDYNDTVESVNRDQHTHDYSRTRIRGNTYFKKIFFHLLDICVWNSYVLYKKNGGPKNNLDFRKTLIERLIQNYHGKLVNKPDRPRSIGSLRLIERHFPVAVPPTPKKATPTRYCAVCCSQRDSKGKKRRRETRYYCKSCNVGLCAASCFEIYHTKETF